MNLPQISRCWTWIVLLGATLAASEAASRRVELETGVSRGSYGRWENALYLDSDFQVTAVIVPSVGGRIIYYSKAGENILYEHPGSDGKTLETAKEWFMMGGYQCGLGPESRGIPEPLGLWLGPYAADVPDEHTLALRSAPDPALGIQLEREVVMDPETGDLGITQRMRNVSDKDASFCLWDRTSCRVGGYAFFPLNRSSRFKHGWTLRRGDSKDYDAENPASDRIQVKDRVLVAWTGAERIKVGADSDAGWIGYVRGRLLFVKYFPVDPAGHYSDGGHTVEVSFDQQLAGLEPRSPEVRLKPGESYEFPEKWALIQLKREVSSFADARGLVKRVPPSPFTSRRR